MEDRRKRRKTGSKEDVTGEEKEKNDRRQREREGKTGRRKERR